MGSKKHRKEKQEMDGNEEIVELDKVKKRKRKLSDQDNEEVVVVNHELTSHFKLKKKKKKNRSLEDTSTFSSERSFDLKEENQRNGIPKMELKDDEIVELNVEDELKPDLETTHENEDLSCRRETSMPQNDLIELIRRIEVLIPLKDSLSYKSRTEKLNWSDIVFSHYSIEECRETWGLLLKNIRRYRTLKEVLEDAKEIVLDLPKSKKYLGMPKKPVSSYQLFYKEIKPLLLTEMPGMELGEISREVSRRFKNLPLDKKSEYEWLAQELKAKYDKELDEFYNNHPEIERPLKKKKEKALDTKPRKPLTPFSLYLESHMRKSFIENGDIQAKNAFKEQCKMQWKELSLKKKVKWINKAEQDIIRYEEEVKIYSEQHSDFIPVSVKHIITKEEIALKEKFSGKPDKPPTSAYSLFSRNLLQSEEIKEINVKERMNYLSNKWKCCTEEEKNEYKNKVNELIEQYKKDYEIYLNSLPEDKREIEMQKNLPKKKSKPSTNETSQKNLEKKKKVKKMKEPATPPISSFRYFAMTNNLDDKVAKKTWKKMNDNERREYDKKLVEIKREYILQFEKYLNSLSMDELEEYVRTKKELKLNSDDFVDDSSSLSSEDDE